MKKILVFGGTTEGREISEAISKKGILVDLHVATEYGNQIVEKNGNLNVVTGRLDCNQIRDIIETVDYECVIDATHPFATEVSRNIYDAISDKTMLIRFKRKTAHEKSEGIRYFSSAYEAYDALKQTDGRILLTTGSKDLKTYCGDEETRQRIFARVIPAVESLELCKKAGLEGSQIIAMQGPFSEKMNISIIEEKRIKVLVTKQSGVAGGTDSKISACLKTGIQCFVISECGCNNSSYENVQVVSTYDELNEIFEKRAGIKIFSGSTMNVVLAGIGPGTESHMTAAVMKAIENADCIFGAERMIAVVKSSAEKFPYYLARDIIPEIEKIKRNSISGKNILILFSGDTGFFSGAKKIHEELKKIASINIKVLPGISSISYLASSIGESWHDCNIVSLHGTQEKEWLEKLGSSLRNKEKCFFITGGKNDIPKIMDSCRLENAVIHLGYNLGYADEKVMKINGDTVLPELKEGLYCGMIVFENCGS